MTPHHSFCPPGFLPDPDHTTFDFEVYHRDGIPWNRAPIPPDDHTCQTQTDGYRYITHFQRCACGAYRLPAESCRWQNRNIRKATP